jgi:hypothetical protein
MQWPCQLITDFSTGRGVGWDGFVPGPAHVRFVADKVALGQVSFRVSQFSTSGPY